MNPPRSGQPRRDGEHAQRRSFEEIDETLREIDRKLRVTQALCDEMMREARAAQGR